LTNDLTKSQPLELKIKKIFLKILQRSFHNLAKLTARSWWTIEQTECSRQLRQLERHWTTVKGWKEILQK